MPEMHIAHSPIQLDSSEKSICQRSHSTQSQFSLPAARKGCQGSHSTQSKSACRQREKHARDSHSTQSDLAFRQQGKHAREATAHSPVQLKCAVKRWACSFTVDSHVAAGKEAAVRKSACLWPDCSDDQAQKAQLLPIYDHLAHRGGRSHMRACLHIHASVQ